MRLNINFHNIRGDGATIDYVDRRLSFAFSRLNHIVNSTVITVSDVNGPRGGIDKLCRVVVKASGLRSVVITERQANLRLAIDRGIARASQTLTRKLKRQQYVMKHGFMGDYNTDKKQCDIDFEGDRGHIQC